MENNHDLTAILNMFSHPVFWVSEDVVTAVNHHAEQLNISIGVSIEDLLVTGQSELKSLAEGWLSLTVCADGFNHLAAVTPYADGHLFHLQTVGRSDDNRMMLLTSQQINKPLSNVVNVTDRLLASDALKKNAGFADQIGQLNKNLYQLMRIVKNLECAGGIGQTFNPATVDISALVHELFEKTSTLNALGSRKLALSIPYEAIICYADTTQIERAFFNLLSNAVKYSPEGSEICVKLASQDDRAHFSIENVVDVSKQNLSGMIFQTYLREPGIEDGRYGLGLGLSVVQSIAYNHNGTLLMDQPKPDHIRFTFSFPLKKRTSGILRSNILTFDYAGGHDHALLELSDILPSDNYKE